MMSCSFFYLMVVMVGKTGLTGEIIEEQLGNPSSKGPNLQEKRNL